MTKALLDKAQEALKNGEFSQALELAKEILNLDPNHDEALGIIGNLAFESGKPMLGLNYLKKAVAAAPLKTSHRTSLACVHSALGDKEAAFQEYAEILRLTPDDPKAHFLMAMALSQKGDSQGAEKGFLQALVLDPEFEEAIVNLGVIHLQRGNIDKAEEYFLKAKAADSLFNLAGIYFRRGERERAVATYQEVIGLRPGHAQAFNNLGHALNSLGRIDEAIEAFREAARLEPSDSHIFNNLGQLLRIREKYPEALQAISKALILNPRFAAAYVNLGNTLLPPGELAGAVKAMEQAVRHEPGSSMAWGALAHALCAQGRIEESLAASDKALKLEPEDMTVRCNMLMTLCYSLHHSPEKIASAHFAWGKKMLREPLPLKLGNKGKIRIGYVSPDFRTHSVNYFSEPILRQHDQSEFEIFLYASVTQPDGVTRELKEFAPNWRDILPFSDKEAAELIAEDGIDILIDLAGHTAHNRLGVFAYKPAPVQITWIGYPATTGLQAMDYRLTDAFADPLGQTEAWHSEKLLRLPGCFLCYQPPSDSPEIDILRERLPGQVVFGCCNNLSKLNPELIGIWAEILRQVPQSVMIIKNRGMRDQPTQDLVAGWFEDAGIIRERISFIGRINARDGHLGVYNLIDVALDTYPYHGTTTSFEALWMGVPVITLAGASHVSRVGVSILENLGLGELIAQSSEEYIMKAVGLAYDPERLLLLRLSLRERLKNSALIDAPKFTRQLENLYRGLCR